MDSLSISAKISIQVIKTSVKRHSLLRTPIIFVKKDGGTSVIQQ